MLVRFWGTRGSIPVPGPTTVRYGGNTACVEVTTDAGTRLILDCGTGARELGAHMVDALASPYEVSILLSHTHWDHIQGLPFFRPIYQDTNTFHFYAARGMNKQVYELVAGQMELSYFPVRLDQLRAKMSFREVGEEVFQIGDVVVQPMYLNHTTLCLGYRITADGATLVYATDHEMYTRLPLTPGGEVIHSGDLALIAFARNADLLIHDAQYTDVEYPLHVGWGHSTARYAAAIAVAAKAKHLALFHHDPYHSDEAIDRQVEKTAALLARLPSPPRVFAAAEGQALELRGTASAEVALEQRQDDSKRSRQPPLVLIADDDRLITRIVQDSLREDGYEVLVAGDGEEALSLAMARRPHVVILDGEMPRATGFEVLARLRQDPAMRSVPVIMLTSLDSPEHIAQGFELGASDYITKPFTRTILQARVRSWLVRSGVL